MQHLAIVGPAVVGPDLPLLRRGSDQQGARNGPGLAGRLPQGTDAGRATGGLAKRRDAELLLVGRGMGQAHAVEIRLQFLGDQQGQGGIDPLPHLHLGHDQGDHAVAADLDEGVRLEGLARGRSLRRPVDLDADDQSAADRGARLKQPTPAEVDVFAVRHDRPHAFAA